MFFTQHYRFFIEKKKVNVNAGRYIRYESFFVSLQKRRMKHIIHSETKNINTQ